MKIALAHGVAYVTKIRGGGWCLESIFVDEHHRNKGIGKRLMHKMLAKCNPPIYLFATSELGGDVKMLFKFYESFGFEKTKQPRNDNLGFNYNMVLWGGHENG